MDLRFSPLAWEEYHNWQNTNKSILKRIYQLVKDILRNPFEGIGKPEPLRENLSGYWRRGIDERNRIVYKIENNICYIVHCKGHYS